MAADISDWLDDVAWVDVAGDDLREERSEHEIILIVDHTDFVVGVGVENMVEIYRGL